MVHPRAMRYLTACLFAALGCGEAASPATIELLREQRGDTAIVTSLGSQWGGTAELVEELRIGVVEGDPEYMFGGITGIAADADGVHVRDVGGEGQGPGEYLRVLLGMTVRIDGRLQIYDPYNERLSLYERDGTPSESWRVPTLWTTSPMWMGVGDETYIKFPTGPIEEGQSG